MYLINKLPSECKQCTSTDLNCECISSVGFQSTMTRGTFLVRIDVLDSMVFGGSSNIVLLAVRLGSTGIPVDLFDDTNSNCFFHLRFGSSGV